MPNPLSSEILCCPQLGILPGKSLIACCASALCVFIFSSRFLHVCGWREGSIFFSLAGRHLVLLEHTDNSAAKRLRSRRPSRTTSYQGPKRNSRDDTNIRPSDFPIKRFTILDSCRLQPSKAKFQSDSADVADQTGEASLDSLDTLEAGELAPATPGTFSSANKRRKGAARGLFPPLSGSIGCRVGPKFGHSQVVVIGLRLEREAIEAALDACLMTDDEIDSAAVGSTRAPLFTSRYQNLSR